MAYRFVEMDVSDEIPEIRVESPNRGVAVLVRYRRRPLDFWMEEVEPGQVLTRERLARRVSGRLAERILAERIREELMPPDPFLAMPALTIVVDPSGEPEQLRRCLDAIRAAIDSRLARSAGIEIIVIGREGLDDFESEVAAGHPQVRYLRCPGAGLNAARNLAAREASGDLVAYLNDEVIMDPWWLEALAEAWAVDPDAGGFTGLVLPAGLETEAQVLFEKSGGFRIGPDRGFVRLRSGQEVHGACWHPLKCGFFGAGKNMVFQRRALLECGGFDEAQDSKSPAGCWGPLDLFYRLMRAGYPIRHEPGLLVFLQGHQDMKGLQRAYWDWGVGFLSFLGKVRRTQAAETALQVRLFVWWLRHWGRRFVLSIVRPSGLAALDGGRGLAR